MNIETKEISQVVFSVISPEEIVAKSVVEITKSKTIENGINVDNGLFDLKMGSIRKNEKCGTCQLTRDTGCPGHFGYLDLTIPNYHPIYIEKIKKVLQVVCQNCSNVLISNEDKSVIIKSKNENRLNKVIEKLKNNVICQRCDSPQRPIKKDKADTLFHYEIKNQNDEVFKEHIHPCDTLDTLKKINVYDAEVIGFNSNNRPEWMILTKLLISPPIMRPTIITDSNQKGEDDITIELIHIVDENKKLKELIEKGEKKITIDASIDALFTYIKIMLVGSNVKLSSNSKLNSSRTNQPLKSIAHNISKKSGRIRRNISGKRVNFSARSVITPDPNLELDQLGMPTEIAQRLTFPETVNFMNKERLLQYCLNAKLGVYPMAITHTRGNITRSLEYIKEDILLEYGDTITRQIIDNDIILFNRQPTLHKMSMMAFKIKVMPEKTFRINLSVTTPFNADFDGDEMNGFLPQSVITANEIWSLARPSKQIITPQTNSPIIGIVQDSLLGAYMMTKFSTNIPRSVVMDILCTNDEFTKEIKNNFYKGNELVSGLLPEINIVKKTNTGSLEKPDEENKYDSIIRVINGQIKSGALDKSILGAKKANTFAHLIWLNYGPDYTKKFLSLIQKYTNRFLLYRGFSVGLGDIIARKEVKDDITKIVEKMIQENNDIITRINNNLLIPPPGVTVDKYFESISIEMFGSVLNIVGDKFLNSVNSDENSMKAMIVSGSKGDVTNAGQMVGCLGQQSIMQKRVPTNYGINRTLPYFTRDNLNCRTRGFIPYSFVDGLPPDMFFFHAITGREGVIDTAIKTANTGYISRKLIKALEDLSVSYDNKVTNSSGQVIQYIFGDDGINPIYAEEQHYENINKSILELKKEYSGIPEEVEQIVDDYKFMLQIFYLLDKVKPSKLTIPININRIIESAKNGFKNSDKKVSKIEAYNLIKKLNEDLPKLFVNQYNDIALEQRFIQACRILNILIREKLSSNKIIEYGFTKKQVEFIIAEIKSKYLIAISQPGEMVGAITAQSIGEPSTQLTLNSFTYETEVIIRNENKKCYTVQLGKFVEYLCEKNKEGLTYYPEKDTTYAPTLRYYEIQGSDEDGNVDWYQIEAGTKHPVINEDGSNTMLKVTTEYNQEVIATKAKSFLTLVNGKLVPTNGSDLSTNDFLPVSIKAIDHEETYTLPLKKILSPEEYIYGSEVEKAKSVMGGYQWWKTHFKKTFILPYSRSDIFVKRMKSDTRITFQDGFIYPKVTMATPSLIPEEIPLDFDFGYFIGAYCADGCLHPTQVKISKNDRDFLIPVERLMTRWNINSKYVTQEDKNQEKWTSSDISIFSTVLREIIYKLCGRYSHKKSLHHLMMFTNYEFKSGFLCGYFGGDGTIRKDSINVSSVSLELLKDVNTILSTLGIYSTIHKCKKQEYNNRGTLPENIKQMYYISIRNASAVKLANILTNIHIKHKQAACIEISKITDFTEHRSHQIKIPNKIIIGDINKIEHEDRNGNMEDVVFVKIKSIEEVPNTTDYAYDLSVKDIRNFNNRNGLISRDTFHSSGIGKKTNVTAGVPRLEELIGATKNSKTPYLIIKIKDRQNKKMAEKIKNDIINTILEPFVDLVEVCFDPDDNYYSEDKQMIKDFRKYTINHEIPSGISPFLIRLKLNRTKMLFAQMTMTIIQSILSKNFSWYVITSNDNAPELIVRVKLIGTFNTREEILNQMWILLQQTVIRGVKGIDLAAVREDEHAWEFSEKEQKMIKIKEYYIDTDGINLSEILTNPDIDTTRTRSTDIHEMLEVFGIEAARNTLVNEITNVLTDSGAYVNYHHLSLLTDMMTHTGSFTQISRFGFTKLDRSPLSNISFETTTEELKKAALMNSTDHMRNVTARIMFNQVVKGGTGKFDILMDYNSTGISGDKIDELL